MKKQDGVALIVVLVLAIILTKFLIVPLANRDWDRGNYPRKTVQFSQEQEEIIQDAVETFFVMGRLWEQRQNEKR